MVFSNCDKYLLTLIVQWFIVLGKYSRVWFKYSCIGSDSCSSSSESFSSCSIDSGWVSPTDAPGMSYPFRVSLWTSPLCQILIFSWLIDLIDFIYYSDKYDTFYIIHDTSKHSIPSPSGLICHCKHMNINSGGSPYINQIPYFTE